MWDVRSMAYSAHGKLVFVDVTQLGQRRLWTLRPFSDAASVMGRDATRATQPKVNHPTQESLAYPAGYNRWVCEIELHVQGRRASEATLRTLPVSRIPEHTQQGTCCWVRARSPHASRG